MAQDDLARMAASRGHRLMTRNQIVSKLLILAIGFVVSSVGCTLFVQQPPPRRGESPSGASLRREARGGEETKKEGTSRLDPDGTGIISLEALDNADIWTLLSEGDTFKEADRLYRRPVFGPKEWKKHRSSKRITSNLGTLIDSRISRVILFEVLLVIASAALALLFYEPSTTSFIQQTLNDPSWKPFTVSLVPFTLTSFSLSLLLVFKTNSSYARWWEARIIWGGIVNKSRDIVRQVVARFDDKDNHLKEVMTGLTSAYSRALTFHLSDQTDRDKKVLREKLEEMLPQKDVEDIMNCTHKPMTVTGKLTYYLQEADLDNFTRLQIDKDLIAYSDFYGMCERIYKTPIPLSYTRLTARFLSVWLLFLPFAVYKEVNPHWLVVPVCALIALFIFGIEELGILIEEPFSVLPLSTISDGIRASIFEALEIDKKRWPKEQTAPKAEKNLIFVEDEDPAHDEVQPKVICNDENGRPRFVSKASEEEPASPEQDAAPPQTKLAEPSSGGETRPRAQSWREPSKADPAYEPWKGAQEKYKNPYGSLETDGC